MPHHRATHNVHIICDICNCPVAIRDMTWDVASDQYKYKVQCHGDHDQGNNLIVKNVSTLGDSFETTLHAFSKKAALLPTSEVTP